jgi:hypothetical protein
VNTKRGKNPADDCGASKIGGGFRAAKISAACSGATLLNGNRSFRPLCAGGVFAARKLPPPAALVTHHLISADAELI